MSVQGSFNEFPLVRQSQFSSSNFGAVYHQFIHLIKGSFLKVIYDTVLDTNGPYFKSYSSFLQETIILIITTSRTNCTSYRDLIQIKKDDLGPRERHHVCCTCKLCSLNIEAPTTVCSLRLQLLFKEMSSPSSRCGSHQQPHYSGKSVYINKMMSCSLDL